LEIQSRLGLPAPDDARLLTENVVSLLGAVLQPFDRKTVADALFEPLSSALRRGETLMPANSIDALVTALGELEGVPEGFAKEQTEVVAQLFAQHLDDGVFNLLRARLPDSVASSVEGLRASPRSAPISRGDLEKVGVGRTLSTGRPGSGRPISESNPSAPHQHSVAASDNPHADTKLSSASSALNAGHDLATGKPGSDKPVADYKGD